MLGDSSNGGNVETCRLQTVSEDPPKSVRATLYFDGTLNNRTNVAAGINRRASRLPTSGSYDNNESNVARLEKRSADHNGYDFSFSLYVEGIGTQDLVDDSTRGAALGTGHTGVEAKVTRGINLLVAKLNRLVSGRKISHLHLDAFGFSRGAAAARHYVHRTINDRSQTLISRLRGLGYQVGSVSVKFLGLFDTVASHGVRHANDTNDLNLDAIRVAEKVVQLAAGDEHRANFRLTNIRSAGSNGREIFLPGAHSDIGGGYRDGVGETDLELFSNRCLSAFGRSGKKAQLLAEADWFVNRGWYTRTELHIEHNFDDRVVLVSWSGSIKGTRARIGNKYDRIPLYLMADFAAQNGVNHSRTLTMLYRLPPSLEPVKQRIDTYVASGSSRALDWIDVTQQWLKDLRHDFFHMSAHESSMGMGPERVGGQRGRRIQNG